MSDHPIPDDLVAIARRIHMTQFDDADLCDCADDELLDADTLAALVEWADGALIDPNGWRRLDAKVAERWHHHHDTDGKPICNHPERDHCQSADEGTWSPWTHVITERADQ